MQDKKYDEVILATGIVPRTLDIDGIEHPMVMNYLNVLRDHKAVGQRVAIIGAGGIGFDVAEYLVEQQSLTTNLDEWLDHWGIDKTMRNPGALKAPEINQTQRQVYVLQRKASKVGAGLGKTTGWIHRASLARHNVAMINSVSYEKIDDTGLHIKVGDKPKLLEVDNIIICAGQEPLRELQSSIEQLGLPVHIIGGADVAAELDAKTAIRQGAELAAKI